jgi:hypothetical protein
MENFIISLDVMWQGMMGIFVFMSIFYLIIVGLEKIDRLFTQKDE